MNSPASPPSRWTFSGVGIPTVLFLALLGINGLAISSMISARRDAVSIAREELQLQTYAQAKSVEAVLASLRGDLLFLSQAPAFSRALEVLRETDPYQQRQGRLDLEGTIFLFVESHPALARLSILDRGGQPLLATGRRDGHTAFLGLDEMSAGPANREKLVRSVWPLGGAPQAGVLEAWLDPEALLSIVAPTTRERLQLLQSSDSVPQAAAPDADRKTVLTQHKVNDASWDPPIAWMLVRRETESRLLDSVDVLIRRFRATTILNILVMSLALILFAVALRQVRRAARLEAESRHQEERRELERKVQHADRLASIGRLAAGMAHEINNPLAGMANYISLLREDLREGRSDGISGHVDRIHEGLNRVAGIVRQVLSFAAPGRGPQSDVDVVEVLERTAEFVRSNPEFRGIAVEVRPGVRELRIPANPTTLGQLFLNLLLNACREQPNGGRVFLACTRRTSDGACVVTIEDEGPGLSEEVRKHLFEPFHSTRGSTGLGLAICHGIVAEHGGTIRGENRTEGGARFVVTLPETERP